MEGRVEEIAVMIDESEDRFENRMLKFSRGDLAVIKTMMNVVYQDLVTRKNMVLQSDSLSEEEKTDVAKDVYAELIKIERKVGLIEKREKSLAITVFDSPNHK